MAAHPTSSSPSTPSTDIRQRETVPPRIVADGMQLREAVLAARRAGHTVGLVPTMGALHEGHLSLVDRARAECDVTIVTVFVNPMQFGPGEDFQRYPRDLFADVALLGRRGCNLVFAPKADAMYPPGYATTVDVGPLGQVLEGEHRPTHFRGVATIVLKLFQLAPADRAYFGRKDYQQTLVVRRMTEDLNVPIDIRVCPIVREPDGLAMSSRNVYLTADERRRASSLSRALRLAEEAAARGERQVAALRREMEREISGPGGIELQYIAFVADGTVTPVETITGPTTIALAAKVGSTRLIDNTLVNVRTTNDE
jgi:pantoate--beta-alanine ligase